MRRADAAEDSPWRGRLTRRSSRLSISGHPSPAMGSPASSFGSPLDSCCSIFPPTYLYCFSEAFIHYLDAFGSFSCGSCRSRIYCSTFYWPRPYDPTSCDLALNHYRYSSACRSCLSPLCQHRAGIAMCLFACGSVCACLARRLAALCRDRRRDCCLRMGCSGLSSSLSSMLCAECSSPGTPTRSYHCHRLLVGPHP